MARSGLASASASPLARGELRDLLAEGKRGGDRRARERLVRQYLPLVRAVARRHAWSGEALDDLVQVGAIGLIASVDRFDPQRGSEFLSFALPHITGEIKRHLRDRASTVRIPRRVQEDDAEGTRRARSPLSLSTDPELGPCDERDVFDDVAPRVLLAAGARALDGRERRIVLLHHFGGFSQAEVARTLGISQIHVSRLYRSALAKLRSELGDVS